MFVKICCISSPGEAELARLSGAHALGLVGPMPSGPGILQEEQIAHILRSVPSSLRTFLLSSETTPDRLLDQVARLRPSTLQLVDRPEPGTYRSLKNAFPSLELVQVVHVVDEHAISESLAVAPNVDALLLDSGRPDKAVKELGGTGRSHDWNISRRIVEAVGIPVWLAGGLRPENVRQAIEQVRPYGVDVCSGVRSRGKLDPARLQAFIQALSPGT